MKVSRGSRWAAAAGIAIALGFGATPASAQEASCYYHPAWFNDGPGGHGKADDQQVTLNPFNPAWEQDHWESITVYGNDGTWFTHDHPPAGVYKAPGDEGLEGWQVCKGYDHPVVTTTTVAAPTTVAATPTTGFTASSVPVPVATPVPGGDTPVEIDLTQAERLPETGRNTDLLLLAGTLTAAAGISLLVVRRRPA